MHQRESPDLNVISNELRNEVMRKSNTVSGNDCWTAEELKTIPFFVLMSLPNFLRK